MAGLLWPPNADVKSDGVDPIESLGFYATLVEESLSRQRGLCTLPPGSWIYLEVSAVVEAAVILLTAVAVGQVAFARKRKLVNAAA